MTKCRTCRRFFDVLFAVVTLPDRVTRKSSSQSPLSHAWFAKRRAICTTRARQIVSSQIFRIGWFSNRTGTWVDDCARKLKNWLDQWQSGKLGTWSRVITVLSARFLVVKWRSRSLAIFHTNCFKLLTFYLLNSFFEKLSSDVCRKHDPKPLQL